MKLRTIIISTLIVFMLPASLVSQQKTKKNKKPKSETINLFNGKDLGNWVFHLKDQSVDPSTVFTVKDGVISISGSPFGYMRTKESYSDYVLNVEWRWPTEATNSGIFIHAQTPDTIWLKCIECQLKAGLAGDFVCMNGADINERKDKPSRVIKKLAESSEKSAGEWNSMEIACFGNTVTVTVNGVLQNKATGSNINAGHICLQSEGKEIHFRNVKLTRNKQ